MKSSSIKRPFIIRTVIAMTLILVTVSIAATYTYAQKLITDVEKDIEYKLDNIAENLIEYKYVKENSIGLNENGSIAVINNYRNAGLEDLKADNVFVDVGLYDVKKDSNGNDIDIQEVSSDKNKAPTKFRLECEMDNKKAIKEGAAVYHNSSAIDFNFVMTYATFESSKIISGTDYVVKIYAQASPLKEAVRVLSEFYVCVFLVFFLVGLMLIVSHNNTIEKRFETEKKRRNMMDSMAHEMKTPLSVIRGFGELLLEENNESKRKEFTKNIISEAESMNDIIISMLDYSKMEAGTYPMELSSLSVKELMEEQIKYANVLIQRKNLDVELQLQDVPIILADEKLVNNIISNFISNAISHSVSGGKIRFEVKSDGREIYIGVFNQGNRVAPADMEKLWDSFYRNRAANEESSGLGLAIVRNACLMHNGTYGCCNEDDGITFWARIQSMEDNMRMIESNTGPVIGVAGQTYCLKGIVAIAVGIILQGLFIYPQISGVLSQINIWSNGIEETVIGIASGWWALLTGSIIVILGVYSLIKNEVFNKSYLIMAVAIAGMNAVMLVMELIVYNSKMALISMMVIVTWSVMLFAFSIIIINNVIDISFLTKNVEKNVILKKRKIIYIISCTVWMMFVVILDFSNSVELSGPWYYFIITAGNIMIICYYAVTLLQCWKWFDGKIKI